MKVQLNLWIEENVRDRLDDFISKNKELFKRQGKQSQAAELVIEAGLDICEKEAEKIKNKNQQ